MSFSVDMGNGKKVMNRTYLIKNIQIKLFIEKNFGANRSQINFYLEFCKIRSREAYLSYLMKTYKKNPNKLTNFQKKVCSMPELYPWFWGWKGNFPTTEDKMKWSYENRNETNDNGDSISGWPYS